MGFVATRIHPKSKCKNHATNAFSIHLSDGEKVGFYVFCKNEKHINSSFVNIYVK